MTALGGNAFSGTSTSSPFGQSTFGKPTTSGFTAAPVFGSTGQSLFGQTTQSTGGLFGTTGPAPAFGQAQTTQPSFSGFTSTAGPSNLFGSQPNATVNGSGLFGSAGSSAFGQAKPAFVGFGSQPVGTGLFGSSATGQQPQTQTTGLFGQATPSTSNTSLFGSAGGFGSSSVGGTSIKFNPVTGTDSMVKNGQSQTINTRHQCITCMKEYESKSLEELRVEDYMANRKGPQQGVQGTGSLFGATAQPLFGSATTNTTSGGLFGSSSEQKPLFGSATNTNLGFGSTGSVFGSMGSSSLFGNKPGTTGTTGFGAPAATTATNTFAAFNTSTASPFGANTAQVKPFGVAAPQTSLFGTSTAQPTAGFGTTNTGFLPFGSQPTQNIGLFSQNKTPFGGVPSNTGFSFGQTPTTNPSSSSLFGTKPAVSAFGSPATNTGTTAFGTASPFGTVTNQSSSLFGSAFKPATTGFSFGQTPTTNTSLGGGLNFGGSSLFGNTAANKPGGLFGSNQTGGGLGFGSSAFNNPSATMFGSNTLGGGLSMGGNTSMQSMMGGGNMFAVPASQQPANPLSQHMLALTSIPFGDSPLFRSLLPATGKAEELLRPTSRVAQKTLLDALEFRVSPGTGSSRLKFRPIVPTPTMNKKSIFDGMDEESYGHKKSGNGTAVSSMFGSSPKQLILRSDKERQSSGVLKPLNESGSFNEDKDSSNSLGFRKFTPRTINTPRSQDSPKGSPFLAPHLTTSPVVQSPENTISPKPSNVADTPNSSKNDSGSNENKSSLSENKENIGESSSDSESDLEESVVAVVLEGEPHPTGIVLHRAGYYTIPTLAELASLMDEEGRCIVDNFTIGRLNYGNVFYPESFDIAGLNLDEIVHFRHKEVVVYPNDEQKPPVGTGLNRRAQVTLDRVWPTDKTTRLPISDPERLDRLDYEAKLRLASAKLGTRFVEYRPQTGSWVFKVDHFSKYGLTDSDEEEPPPATDPKKLHFSSLPPPGGAPLAPQTHSPRLLHTLTKRPMKELQEGMRRALNDDLYPAMLAEQQGILLNEDDQVMDDADIKSPFDLDEVEHKLTNGLHDQSPTVRLAHEFGASSHKVQLMKASFYYDSNGQDDFNVDADYMDVASIRNGKMLDVEEIDRTLSEKANRLAKSLVFRTQFADSRHDSNIVATYMSPKGQEHVPEMALGIGKRMVKSQPVVPPPTVRPKTYTLQSIAQISYQLSTHHKLDASLWQGRSYRLGWGPACTLLHLTTQAVADTEALRVPSDQLGTVLEGRLARDTSHCIVQRVRLLPGGDTEDPDAPTFEMSIEGHLSAALEHSVQGLDGECPGIAPQSGVASLHTHCRLAQNLAETQTEPLFTLHSHVWQLCNALWGTLPDLPPTSAVSSHRAVMERRIAVSEWLESVVEREVIEESGRMEGVARVFALLTGRRLDEACHAANSAGDYNCALLLSQLGSGSAVRCLMEQQLQQWVDSQADRLIDRDRVKLMMLVAGIPLLNATEEVINVCTDLDWRRAIALHLWYICSPTASVTDALLRYEDGAFPSDGSPGFASPPTPGYASELAQSSKGAAVYDVCYHLLRLYTTRSHPLQTLLNPATHTADSLDYRLSWLLMRVLDSLGYSHLSEYSASQVHMSFASQLEAHGLWHWAIFVLLHLKNVDRRRSAVLDVLGRHIDITNETSEEAFLKEKLHVPSQWIYSAKATFATVSNMHKEAAWFLIQAGEWNRSHDIIMEHIAAVAIINERYDELERLLGELSICDRWKAISCWSERGSLLCDYLSVVRQMEAVMAARDPSVAYQLERLQPQLTSLCARVTLLPTPTAIHRLAQVEIAKRTAHLVHSLVMIQQGDEGRGGVSTHVLTHLVTQLPLSDDYAHDELHHLADAYIGTITNRRN